MVMPHRKTIFRHIKAVKEGNNNAKMKETLNTETGSTTGQVIVQKEMK